MAKDGAGEDVDLYDEGLVSFEEMINMGEEEVDKLLYEYDTYKEERKRFQADAFVKLPAQPPLVLDCIHFLRVNGGLDTEGIFRVNGDSNAVDKIRDAFNKDLDITDILLSVHQSEPLKNYDVATTLKSYFRLLEDPLVPHVSYERMKQATESQGANQIDGIRSEIHRMQEPNKAILCYTMIFFQDIIDNREINKMSATNLATCLTMSITRFMEKGDGKNHFAAMMEVGLSTKIIALMLTHIDFTEFITPKQYYDLLKSTSYQPHLLPESFEQFLDTQLFRRFKPRYEDEIRQQVGPPPVPGRREPGKKKNKYFY